MNSITLAEGVFGFLLDLKEKIVYSSKEKLES